MLEAKVLDVLGYLGPWTKLEDGCLEDCGNHGFGDRLQTLLALGLHTMLNFNFIYICLTLHIVMDYISHIYIDYW